MIINLEDIDIERLREDLIDYFGTAAFNFAPQAMLEVEKIERASARELIEIADDNGFNIEKYLK